MSKSFTKQIAYALFVILMTNMLVWDASAARLAHELEHNGRTEEAVASDRHAHEPQAAGAADHDESGGAAHQVLHAVDHVQFFPDTSMTGRIAPAAPKLERLHATEQSLPFASFDPPFRPPRSGVFPA
jgi:hypothetical protein